MADEWKPKSARELSDDEYVPKSARALDASPPTKKPPPDPLEGMTWLQKLKSGAGLGMLNALRSITDLAGRIPGAGLASLPEATSQGVDPDELARQRVIGAIPKAEPEFAEALTKDPKHALGFHLPDALPFVGGDHGITWGNVGQFGGEVAATAPFGWAGKGIATNLLGKPLAKAVVPSLVARSLPVVAEGMAQGNILGGPDNRVMGTLAGGVFAGVGSAGARSLGSLANGFVTPTSEAVALMREGIRPSIGQMEPGGFLSKLEEAGQHSALGGEAVTQARQLARDQIQLVGAKKALAPGDVLPEGRVRPGEFIDQLHRGFNDAYDEFAKTEMPTHYEGVPVTRAIRDAFKAVSTDPLRMADAATRDMVNKYLQNQATILDTARQFGGEVVDASAPSPRPVSKSPPLLPASSLGIRAPVGQWAEAPLSEATANVRPRGPAVNAPVAPVNPTTVTTAEPLLAIRRNIRAKLRMPGISGTEQGAMLENAEDLITKALEERLGPKDAARLRDLDGRYANLMALDRAVNAGDSRFGFTPAQLSRAAQNGLSTAEKARGYGGPLRSLGDIGHEVLDARAPVNGAIKQTLPIGLNHAAGPLMSFLNGSGRDFALGLTRPQRAAASLGDLLQGLLPANGPGPNALFAPLEVDGVTRR